MKTAVEWFYDEIKHIIPNDYVKKYEQAKDLESEHLIHLHLLLGKHHCLGKG